MKTRVTPHLIELTYDAALRSFWRKKALSSFLGRSQIPSLPAWLPDESKRDYLSRVFDSLQDTDQGRRKIVQLALFLAEQLSFPDLRGWEDSTEKNEAAKSAVSKLQSYLSKQDEQLRSEQQLQEARRKFHEFRAQTRSSQQTLKSLSDKLGKLAGQMGSSSAGKAFERWFYELMEFSEITARPPFRTGGREVDGSITIGDTTYLVECKFTECPTGAPDVDVFRRKVESKADNTMGVFVSISGFTQVAKNSASGSRTPLLLLDHAHLYHVLGGASSFKDTIERIRRHASQTSEAYLPVERF